MTNWLTIIKQKQATNIPDKERRVINMSSRQLTHIETNVLTKGVKFSITSKTLPHKGIIATIEDRLKDLKRKVTDTIPDKISLAIQNSKLLKENLSMDECKALKELQSGKSIVILPVDKHRYNVIFNREIYLNKCKDRINNGPY